MIRQASTIGIVCPGDTGHVYPALSIALELRRRGHLVVFFQNIDGAQRIREHGFPCETYGEAAFPKGKWSEFQRTLGKLEGIPALKYTGAVFEERIRAGLADFPRLLAQRKFDLLLVDQVTPEAGAVADVLQIPFLTLSLCLPLNQEAALPPYFSALSYRASPLFRAMYKLSNYFFNRGTAGAARLVNAYRAEHGLEPYSNEKFGVSKVGQLCQLSASFDFPRTTESAGHFHYCGSLFDPLLVRDVPFPYQRLNGKPLIYCSFGTLQNKIEEKYLAVIEAVRHLDVQLVISLGGEWNDVWAHHQSEKIIIVGYAPQPALLERAALFISHCGLGGTMQSLRAGTPILAMPVTNDQPGVAARIAWHNIGLVLYAKRADNISRSITRILAEPAFKNGASVQKDILAASFGPAVAADIIDRALQAIPRLR
jgi:zeaxanthin glucosyltransferase